MVPGFLYFLLRTEGKNRYKPLPIFGDKIVDTTFHSVKGKLIPDTIYHQLSSLKLLNSKGDSVVIASNKQKIIILNLFNNKASEPAMQAMAKIFDRYYRNSIFDFISLNVNAHVNNEQLVTLKQAFVKNTDNWLFLYGDTSVVYPYIRKDLLLDVVAEPDGTYLFSNKLLLIDTEGRIRGIYDSGYKIEMDKLDDEIKVLVAETLRNVHDGR